MVERRPRRPEMSGRAKACVLIAVMIAVGVLVGIALAQRHLPPSTTYLTPPPVGEPRNAGVGAW